MRTPYFLLSALALSGCEDVTDGNGCDVPAGSTAPSNCQAACAVGQARNMASGRCEAAACTIDAQVAAVATSEKTVDCGSLPVSASDVQRDQAHRCLLDAVSAGRPLKLIEFLQGIDSQVAYGFTSGGAGGRMILFEYDSNFSAFSSTGGGAVGATTCESYVAVPGCQPSSLATCLECFHPSAPVAVCEAPAPR